MGFKNFTIFMLLFVGFQNQSLAGVQCEARLPYNDSPKLVLNFESTEPKTVFIPGTEILLSSKINSVTRELCIETTSDVEFLASVCGQSQALTLKMKTDADGFITIKCRLN